jgi:1,4-alpha-glucan branching enzyme
MLPTRLKGRESGKLKQSRLLLLFMLCQPGKKLCFMGNEFAQMRPWHWDKPQDWWLLADAAHAGHLSFVRELNRLYMDNSALWQNDFGHDNFQWLNCRSSNPCVFGFSRPMGRDTLLVFLNFSDKATNMDPDVQGEFSLLINSDWEDFGGKTKRLARRKIMKRLPAYSGAVYICHK